MATEATLPLEHFIQAVQSQLDIAQSAMSVKARNLDLPLTFAIRDISMDLRAHVEFARSEIRIRPAGPNDKDASIFHLVFSAISRPMIEENAVAFTESADDAPIEDLKDELSDDERRRLEWVGVRTVGKLRELEASGGARAVGRITSLPVDRLRKALERASAPMVEQVTPIEPSAGEPGDLANLVRIRGRNLVRLGSPRVTVAGEPVGIVRADAAEIVIAPKAHQMHGELRVESGPRMAGAVAFDLRPFWREPGAPPAGGGS